MRPIFSGPLKVPAIVLLLPICLIACEQRSAPAGQVAPAAPASPAVDPETRQRLADLVVINDALKAFYEANGQYPVTPERGSFTSVITAGDAWIPGLVPNYIAALPRDPAGSNDPANQYWYASQGGSYKLIAHGVGDSCGPEVEGNGILRDPARSRPDGSCWAYGFWSESLAGY